MRLIPVTDEEFPRDDLDNGESTEAKFVPVEGEPSPEPSFLRKTADFASGVLAEGPQIAYEGAAAMANALARGAKYATQYATPIAGGVLGGGSLGEVAGEMEPVRQKIMNYNMVEPTFGRGSWFGQGIGKGINALVERGAVSPEAMENAMVAGDLLALAGLKIPRTPIAQMPGKAWDSVRRQFPPAKARAGELYVKSLDTLDPTTPQGLRQAEQVNLQGGALAEAQEALGVHRLPESKSVYSGRQQLATERVGRNIKVRESEAQLHAEALEQAARGLDAVIPSETIDPGRLNFMSKKLESHNQAAQVAAEEGARAAKKSAALATEETALAELAKLDTAVPATKFDPRGEGLNLVNRLKGKSEAAGPTGRAAVKEVFDEAYGKFDAFPQAVANSEPLIAALGETPGQAASTGRVLRNYVDKGQVVEQRLIQLVVDPVTGGETRPFPKSLTLAQWRGVKGEFADAAVRAEKAGDFPAARELGRLRDTAKKGEMNAASKLGPAQAKEYQDLTNAYRNVMVRAFREGHGSRLISKGKEAFENRYKLEEVFPTLKNTSNAHDLMAALGAETAAKTGKSLTRLSEAELLALGRGPAQQIVKPFFESELAEVYRIAGKGKKGAAKVVDYLEKNRKTLEAYGLDFDELRGAATNYNETMARLTGANTSVAKGVAKGVLGTDPTKLGEFVTKSPSPAAAYKDILRVSSDPVWKSSVDTLIKETLKNKIHAGENIFEGVKNRATMEQVFTKQQIHALRQYQTIIKQLGIDSAKITAERGAKSPLEYVATAMSGIPVGFGNVMYPTKWLGRALVKAKIVASEEAILRYLDAALINPKTAREIVAAFKGSKLAERNVVNGVKAEEAALSSLRSRIGRTGMAAGTSAVREADKEK